MQSCTVSNMTCYRYWSMYKLPMFGCNDASQVLTEIQNATKTFPTAYIRFAAESYPPDQMCTVQATAACRAQHLCPTQISFCPHDVEQHARNFKVRLCHTRMSWTTCISLLGIGSWVESHLLQRARIGRQMMGGCVAAQAGGLRQRAPGPPPRHRH